MHSVFSLRLPVAKSARLPAWLRRSDGISIGEWIALAMSGIVCGLLTVYLPWKIRLPGHAILRAVFPMALGISLVPRRGAGTIIGGIAGLVVGAAWWQGVGSGHLATLTSVLALGCLLDMALYKAGPGWRIYPRFAAAGLLANLCAYGVRWGTAVLGIEPAGNDSWPWTTRLVSFALLGAAAGLISAIVWFRASEKPT